MTGGTAKLQRAVAIRETIRAIVANETIGTN